MPKKKNPKKKAKQQPKPKRKFPPAKKGPAILSIPTPPRTKLAGGTGLVNILSDLETYGIVETTVFPDLQGLSRELVRNAGRLD